MSTAFIRTCLIAALSAFGTEVFISAQQPPPPQTQQLPAQQPAAQEPQTPAPASTPTDVAMRLTADDAVRLAAENNLGIQIDRFNPQIQDAALSQAQRAWVPSLVSSFEGNGARTASNSFLSGAVGNSTVTRASTGTARLAQTVPWGANYTIGMDAARSTTNSLFSTFSPQIRSSMSFSYTQQLWRGFRVDQAREQVQTQQKQREIADVQLRQTLATTSRTVRSTYWDLVYAIASLRVQQQSLDVANESLRNTRQRIEIGTTPPIDEVAQLAEVARNEDAVITAEAQISTAEDALRTLIIRSDDPNFWSFHIEPTDSPQFQPATVNTDEAVRNALQRRTDLEQARKQMEATDLNIQLLRDQTRPELSADLRYGLSGLGGTQLLRSGIALTGETATASAPQVVAQRGYGSVLGDLFTNAYPTWQTTLQLTIPLGAKPEDASLARARLQYRQSETQLKSQQMQVTSQVRQAARQVQTNQKRVETTRTARELSERTLDAEQRKLAAGTSEQFQVLQAQRDLATARNNELRALIDYQQSVVDYETVQVVPLR
jgi:outer membrane protein TolC